MTTTLQLYISSIIEQLNSRLNFGIGSNVQINNLTGQLGFANFQLGFILLGYTIFFVVILNLLLYFFFNLYKLLVKCLNTLEYLKEVVLLHFFACRDFYFTGILVTFICLFINYTAELSLAEYTNVVYNFRLLMFSASAIMLPFFVLFSYTLVSILVKEGFTSVRSWLISIIFYNYNSYFLIILIFIRYTLPGFGFLIAESNVVFGFSISCLNGYSLESLHLHRSRNNVEWHHFSGILPTSCSEILWLSHSHLDVEGPFSLHSLQTALDNAGLNWLDFFNMRHHLFLTRLAGLDIDVVPTFYNHINPLIYQRYNLLPGYIKCIIIKEQVELFHKIGLDEEGWEDHPVHARLSRELTNLLPRPSFEACKHYNKTDLLEKNWPNSWEKYNNIAGLHSRFIGLSKTGYAHRVFNFYFDNAHQLEPIDSVGNLTYLFKYLTVEQSIKYDEQLAQDIVGNPQLEAEAINLLFDFNKLVKERINDFEMFGRRNQTAFPDKVELFIRRNPYRSND